MHSYHFSGSPRAIAHVLGTIIVCLLCANTACLILRFGFGYDYALGLIPLFNVDVEGNIPTFFSVCMGLAGAMLFAVIAFDAKNRASRDAIYWFVLSAGFLFIAYDEAFQVHEKMAKPMRALMGNTDLGFFTHGWVVPGLIGTALASLCFVKFLLRLPTPTRRRLLTAAGLFLGGCLGMELINGKVLALQGPGVFYHILMMAEEGLEMAGLATLIHALTSHIAEGCDKVELDLHGDAPVPALPAVQPDFT